MSFDQEYGRIPEFFSERCDTLGLPLATVTSDIRGFIDAILGLEQFMDKINMHRYLHFGNQLFCYLRTQDVSPEESGRIAKEVLEGLREARVPLSSREKQN